MSEKQNFLDYISWRGDLSFDKSPFNCVDALILSQLVYLNFENLLEQPFFSKLSLFSLNRNFINADNYSERCCMGAMINQGMPGLMDSCANSIRFKNVLVCGYYSVNDKKSETQFGAVTFILPDEHKTRVVAYRGTDDSFLGWKEDFNLSYMDVIPSEEEALIYFEKARKELGGQFILTGHSKGGLDSIYTAMNCLPSNKKKILKIYNFDGPGFKQSVLDSNEFKSIRNKIFSFYPQFSVVGMLFNHDRSFEIVNSFGKSFMQHDPFTWSVIGNKFENSIDFTDESKYFSKSFNEWVTKLSDEEKKAFVNNLFNTFMSSGKDKIADFEKDKLQSTKNMISFYKNLTLEERKSITENLKHLLKVFKSNIPMLSIFNSQNFKLRS